MMTFQEEESIDLKKEIRRYLNYWPWFVLATLVTLFSAYIYLRYAPRIYQTTAKVKILDESDGLELPTSAFIFKRSNINLENEIEILTSYIIIERVVRKINLNTKFFEEGTIQTSPVAKLPFEYEQIIDPDSISKSLTYKVTLEDDRFNVINLATEESYFFPEHDTFISEHNLPFNIKYNKETALEDIIGNTYLINYNTIKI